MKHLNSFLYKRWLAINLIVLLIFSINIMPVFAQSGDTTARKIVVIEAIEEANADLTDTTKTEKYCLLACASFPFFRATNYLFWHDFSEDKRLKEFGNSQTKIWISADLHVDNFGAFNNAQEEVIFDLNDFDESVIADYQYDLWRMATSIILAVSNRQPNSLSLEQTKEIEALIDEFTEAYLKTLSEYNDNDQETKTYFTAKNTTGKIKELLEDAALKSRKNLLEKWTIELQDKRRFKSPKENDKLGTISEIERDAIQSQIATYGNTLAGKIKYNDQEFKIKDVAKRLKAGLGSLGQPRYYVLIEGKSNQSQDDRILDIKRQERPTPYQFFNPTEKATYDRLFDNDAQRHEIAYRALTKHTDDYLGWIYLTDPTDKLSGYYSVRELSPNNGEFDDLKDETGNQFSLANAPQSERLEIAKQWGKILATDHARSDQDFDKKYIPYSFEKKVIALTQGKEKAFQKLVKEVAFDYVKQVQADYNSFVQVFKPQNCSEYN